MIESIYSFIYFCVIKTKYLACFDSYLLDSFTEWPFAARCLWSMIII